MPTVVKPSNYLIDSSHEFLDEHVSLANKIHNFLTRNSWTALKEILSSITEHDKVKVHYAFYDQYGYDYELKIRSQLGSYADLRKHGLV